MMIVVPRDPDAILHAVMRARLDRAELWDDAGTLPLGQPVPLDPADLHEAAIEYRRAFGDFHPSWKLKPKKTIMLRHLYWVSRHKAPDRIAVIDSTVRAAFTRGIDAVLQKATASDAKFLAYSGQAMREWHRLLGLVRLTKPREGMLYGEIRSEFRVEDAMLLFLRRRYPGQTIVIRNAGHMHFSGTPERIDSIDIEHAEESEIRKIFDVYYESQYIKERRNIRLLSHFVPKRYWEWISDGRKIARHAG